MFNWKMTFRFRFYAPVNQFVNFTQCFFCLFYRSVSVPASVPASSTGSPREKTKPDEPIALSESSDVVSAESTSLDELLSCHNFYATPEDIEEEKEMVRPSQINSIFDA